MKKRNYEINFENNEDTEERIVCRETNITNLSIAQSTRSSSLRRRILHKDDPYPLEDSI